MNNAIVVLGAAGFIGRRLAEHLAASGETVIAATRRPSSFVHPRIANVVAPFDTAEHFLPLLARAKSVIHAASSSTPGSSAAEPQLDGNLRPMLALIEALQRHPARTLMYLSSGGTLYGDREGGNAHEDDPIRPRSYHGAGKAAAEHFIHAWAMQYEGSAIMLRPSNVYGPGQSPRKDFGIIPTAFDRALRNEPITLWGDGSAVRDYLYIKDFVALCRAALAREPQAGVRIFNASSGSGVRLDALLDAIDGTTRLPLRREYRAMRKVDVQHIVPDNSAARAAFGWQPEITLDTGLQQTWQWFTTRH